jgi:hypothetical protein
LSFLLAVSSVTAQVDSLVQAEKKTKGPYFYEGLNYGSQGNFNPASVLLNRGFEMLLIVLILLIRLGI